MLLQADTKTEINKQIEVKCIYNDKRYNVKSIDFEHLSIDLIGADTINFSEGVLIRNTFIKDNYGIDIYTGDILEFQKNDQIYKAYVEYSPKYGEFITRCDDIFYDQEPLGDLDNRHIKRLRIVGNIFMHKAVINNGK